MHNINRKNCVEAWRGEQRGAVDFSQPMPDKVWAAQEGDPMRPDWFPRSLYGHQSDNASRFELALDPVTPKKLPWKSPRTEFTPVKGLFPQRAGQHGKKGRKTSATLPRDERDRFRLLMPHRARDNCDSTNGVIIIATTANGGATKSGGTSIRIAAQRCLTGEGLIPWA